MRSDATIDKLYIRKITNIATGQPVANKYFDQSLAHEAEGYAKRYTIPLSVRKLGRFVPSFLIKILKR